MLCHVLLPSLTCCSCQLAAPRKPHDHEGQSLESLALITIAADSRLPVRVAALARRFCSCRTGWLQHAASGGAHSANAQDAYSSTDMQGLGQQKGTARETEAQGATAAAAAGVVSRHQPGVQPPRTANLVVPSAHTSTPTCTTCIKYIPYRCC